MKIFELITQLNNMYSFNLAEDYDNIGLLIGDENLEVKKVFTSLDIDFEICMEAVDNGCNVIVSHPTKKKKKKKKKKSKAKKKITKV